MLTITDDAVVLIGSTLDANRENDEDVFRLAQVGTDFGLAMDRERAGDTVIKRDERSILVYENEVGEALSDVTIDAVETPEGQQLIIKTADEG
jgi:Fe-S cluster assembly iron-binding protein IscA